MAQTHARASRGQHTYSSFPLGSWRRLTDFGALACEGLVATMNIDSPPFTSVLLAYLEQMRAPVLKCTRPDAVLVMGNLLSHWATAAVREQLD